SGFWLVLQLRNPLLYPLSYGGDVAWLSGIRRSVIYLLSIVSGALAIALRTIRSSLSRLARRRTNFCRPNRDTKSALSARPISRSERDRLPDRPATPPGP